MKGRALPAPLADIEQRRREGLTWGQIADHYQWIGGGVYLRERVNLTLVDTFERHFPRRHGEGSHGWYMKQRAWIGAHMNPPLIGSPLPAVLCPHCGGTGYAPQEEEP